MAECLAGKIPAEGRAGRAFEILEERNSQGRLHRPKEKGVALCSRRPRHRQAPVKTRGGHAARVGVSPDVVFTPNLAVLGRRRTEISCVGAACYLPWTSILPLTRCGKDCPPRPRYYAAPSRVQAVYRTGRDCAARGSLPPHAAGSQILPPAAQGRVCSRADEKRCAADIPWRR